MDTLGRSRRHFLGRAAASLAGLGLASLLDGVCRSPASPASRAAADSLVPDDSFVRIPRRPSFAFATNLTNSSGAGEAAPILTDYCLGVNLVTNKQYKAFVDATGRTGVPRHWASGTYRAGKEDHPVLWVSLTDAQSYCDWLSTRLSGWTVRLPTEAEWENAARGPDQHTYPWGDSPDTSYDGTTLSTRYNYNAVCAAFYLANQRDTPATFNNPSSPRFGTKIPLGSLLSINARGNVSGWIDHGTFTGFVYTDIYRALVDEGGFTTPVGAYPAGRSGYGCFDMAGNAFEWTASLITAQNGAERGMEVNAVRGGSWYSTGSSGRSTYRGEGRSGRGGYHSVGFRVAAVPR